MHFVWEFLSLEDRWKVTHLLPFMRLYARLRCTAVRSHELQPLRRPRPPPSGKPIDLSRTWKMGAALLAFNFVYGDLIRWLGGEYTYEHRDWPTMLETLERVRTIQPPPGHPTVDIDRAYATCAQGAPLAGHFKCTLQDVVERNRYDNHPTLQGEHSTAVRKKLALEEENSFHLILPRFLFLFLPGLHISPLTWVVRKGKGRLCVDCSSEVTSTAAVQSSAPNSSIPKPGKDGREDESPSLFYGTALVRHLTHIWRLRLAHPRQEIYQASDDIHAAFHRILYHPDLAIVFAYVYEEFLVIPVGVIFGGGNSPGWYCLTSEVRAHLAAHGVEDQALTELAKSVRLSLPPTPREVANFAQAVPDSMHQPTPDVSGAPFHHSSFVDDNATAATIERIYQAINSSIMAAYIIYGFPEENERRTPPLSAEKWVTFVSWLLHFLGFDIDTR